MPSKAKVNRLYWFCHGLINVYMYTLCRLKLSGTKYIPRDGGLIIASNHIAGADPFLLGSTVPRELWFMAKKELFEVPIQGKFIAKVNAYPVDRFGFDLEVIKTSIKYLKEGKALIMFPEGTRSKDGQIKEGKIGVGMLARKAGVPIVPAYIANTKKAWWNFLKGKRMITRFGQIIPADWINSRENSKEGYKEITDLLMQRIRGLQKL
jgi:1-acyl-sn-glycerol-3-phosphate acyltransferase